MEDCVIRMIAEREELEGRMNKLCTELSTKGCAEKVGMEHYNLMLQQVSAMVSYHLNLSLRISLLIEEE